MNPRCDIMTALALDFTFFWPRLVTHKPRNNSARPVATFGQLQERLQSDACFELALLYLIVLEPRSHAQWSGEVS